MITLTASVRNSLPRVTYVKYSDWILTTCLVYVFGALVEFALINFHDSLEARKREKLKNKLRNIDMERGVSGMARYFFINIVMNTFYKIEKTYHELMSGKAQSAMLARRFICSTDDIEWKRFSLSGGSYHICCT